MQNQSYLENLLITPPIIKPVMKGECRACCCYVQPDVATDHLTLRCVDKVEEFLNHKNQEKDLVEGFLIRVCCADRPWTYWMYATVPKHFKFSKIDKFLKDYWCECCGHTSSLRLADPSKPFWSDSYQKVMKKGAEIGMELRPGMMLNYEYDSGTSTELKLEVISTIFCSTMNIAVVMQNDTPLFPCVGCNGMNISDRICTNCEMKYCPHCSTANHPCNRSRSAFYLPIVNSPRIGKCGYTGPDQDQLMTY